MNARIRIAASSQLISVVEQRHSTIYRKMVCDENQRRSIVLTAAATDSTNKLLRHRHENA